MISRKQIFVTTALVVAGIALSPRARGQPQRPPPHIGFVYPAGGEQGKTIVVSVGGQNLADATAVLFNTADVRARVVSFERPLRQKEINELREKGRKLKEKRAAAEADPARPSFTPADRKAEQEIREKLRGRAAGRANPALAETVTLEVTLAPGAPPGARELRLLTSAGLSNPFVFRVGQLAEFSEPVVTVTNPRAPPTKRAAGPRARRSSTAMNITLPATLNGQILPGEVDRFRFVAKKGQRVVIAAHARSLIPYLADAVPGWFQATLTLLDDRGREVAYDDRFRFNPDPVIACTIPEDGDYVVEVRDSIYRGREDFVYRVDVGELPFVTDIFPLGATAGSRAVFQVTGWNLPLDRLAMDTTDKASGGFLLAVRNRDMLSNVVSFALDQQPEVAETEGNDRPENAQPLTLPVIVNGRIDRASDLDVFSFTGNAGDAIVAEVIARRLGSPLDSTLRLSDAKGASLAFNDDDDDKGAGLLTHQADSRISFTLPATGTYFLTVADAQHHGGPAYAYRLRVNAPRPGFDLRVTPSSINLAAGADAPIVVYALRRDGFTGEIKLGLRHAPPGFHLNGARIPAGQDKVRLTLHAPPRPQDEPFDFTVVGQAVIQGETVTRAAIPAEDMMQAFAYRHLVPSKGLKAMITGRAQPFGVLTRPPLRIPAGGSLLLRVSTAAIRSVSNIQLELSEPPEGITAQPAAGRADSTALVLVCDAKVKPGLQGNLILEAFGDRRNPKATQAAARARRVTLGVVPAIPFEIVAAETPSK